MAKFWAKRVKLFIFSVLNQCRQTEMYPIPITRKTGKITFSKTSMP